MYFSTHEIIKDDVVVDGKIVFVKGESFDLCLDTTNNHLELTNDQFIYNEQIPVFAGMTLP